MSGRSVRAAVLVLCLGLVGTAPAAATDSAARDHRPVEVRIVDLGMGTGPGEASQARFVTETGVALGTFAGVDDTHAFRWEDGVATELPGLGGSTTEAVAGNDRGEVVGWSSTRDGGERHAVLWTADGSVVDLGTPGLISWATGINRRGTVTGSTDGPEGIRGWIWRDGQRTDLGDLGSGWTAVAGSRSPINDRGQVTGTSRDAAGFPRAFRWTDGVMTALPGPAEESSIGRAINRRGVVLASEVTADGLTALLWDGSALTDVGGPGGPFASATALSDRGHVVGHTVVDGKAHAFLADDRGFTDLGTLPGHDSSFAESVNRKGQVVGVSGLSSDQSSFRAVLWYRGATVDLGTLPGGSTSSALDLNDRGQIVGLSDDADGVHHAVMWTIGRVHR